ncbi:MAG: mobile mystery protein A [Sediminibacterium sp.]|jgi:predicted DNA-binding mobile mystery protein A|nr:mobile mystery protein A [Chitinophagaceae bacterium]MCA6500395.1 mobile mystery protein A [Chitinophagaceae bacterium]MCA6515904.1 mobile mystery protein A [Chitinophagaceae bacterium]MCE2974659.1 mobile mystery protein A [Sediminibacterium sp.]
MKQRFIHFQQLNNKLLEISPLQSIPVPPIGWIKSIRTALGMSLQQLGKKLNVTKQAALDIERREREGSITIKSLKDVANALDMQLVYGFVPKDGSLDALIEKKATALAKQIVMRTHQTMKLEDQANSAGRIDDAIRERVAVIKNEMPKILWDSQ